jgi:hypothetical protein
MSEGILEECLEMKRRSRLMLDRLKAVRLLNLE